MTKASHGFQIFVKPTGPACNLDCTYCYYLDKDQLYPEKNTYKMPENLLEKYIKQHIEASPDTKITFSWHGGEPTILGLEYYQKIVQIQRKHCPPGKTIHNGIQTNGTLLDQKWCQFLAKEKFAVGISIDGPPEIHNMHRMTKDKKPTYKKTIRGYNLLKKHGIYTDILCVVNAVNIKQPLRLYRFFKQLDAGYITFLPLVDHQPEKESKVSDISITPRDWGIFLSTIFDEWVAKDIGKIKIQIFEEALRTAFNQEHSLCIFRPTCGDIPALEHNGDFYTCDHYVNPEHLIGNIQDTSLVELLEDPRQIAFGEAKQKTLPRYCRECEVLSMCNGECPKNRFIETPDGEPGLNYLCEGYRHFFNHCQPFIRDVATVWRHQNKR